MNNNVFLAGFMGTGKTTVGQLVARHLGWRFVDTDDEIVNRAGKTIPEIFAEAGETHFRQIEHCVCVDLAAGREQVIATGGGMWINPLNRPVMTAGGLVICLTAEPSTIRERLANFEGRPLAPDWESLLVKRRAAYAEIPYQIETTHRTPQEIAEEVVSLCRELSQ